MFHPEVVQVIPNEDYTVEILFQDGKMVQYDAKPLIHQGVFRALQNKDFFMTHCTVLNHTLAWDLSGNYDPCDCIDLDPYVLYYGENNR